ncbi:PE-PPE domain-containing protein [Nocardia sp. NPDC050435]|uniref:PE-PPE domain-containing protein n=1 Tax=Nocardia sp. NPDC050435 TaxID=3155040 RepID=UPI0033F6E144
MIDVLTLAGTGERPHFPGRVYGLLSAVTQELDSDRFASTPVVYPASYGPMPDWAGIDYESSVQDGLDALVAAIRATDRLVGLIGYSQGATIVSRLLDELGAGAFPDIELSFAALVANPHRAPGWASIDGSVSGYGIAGAHKPWPTDIPIWEVANPRDPICSCPANSPLRGFADLTGRFSISDPARWGVDLVERALEHSGQKWFLQPGWWDARRAVDDALNYLIRGEHTMYISAPIGQFAGRTYCQELAHLINAHVRE